MFTINIYIQHFALYGLEALDWRRARGLPDDSHVHSGLARRLACDVSEGFARAHFPPMARRVMRAVSPEKLAKGDVRPCDNSSGIDFAELTDERVRELWLAGEHDPDLA